MKKIAILFIAAACLGLAVSCGSTRSVSRVGADEQIDLSGRWNDTDAQLVAETMIKDVMGWPWLAEFTQANGKKPIVIVGAIRNRSSEHIDTSLFTKSIERELLKTGKVSFVANDAEREGLRDERMQQQTESSAESMKRLGQETGADFMLQGQISSVTDAVDGKKVVFYKVNLELVNIETNEKVWIGDKQIKKLVGQNALKL
jgi:uncharacterized protein (TIGR02722 family)